MKFDIFIIEMCKIPHYCILIKCVIYKYLTFCLFEFKIDKKLNKPKIWIYKHPDGTSKVFSFFFNITISP